MTAGQVVGVASALTVAVLVIAVIAVSWALAARRTDAALTPAEPVPHRQRLPVCRDLPRPPLPDLHEGARVPMSTFLSVAPYVALAGLAGAILAFGIEPVRRVLRRRRARAASQEPVHPTPATTTTRRLLLPALRQLVHRRPPRPTAWAGATPGWSPAQAVAAVQGDPALTTPAMHMAADHAALTPISVAIDEFDAAVEAALDRFLRGQPLIRMRLAASVEATGEIDLEALRDLLDLPAELVTA